MAESWSWEPIGTQRWRDRQNFMQQANTYAASQLVGNQAAAAGVDPTTLNFPTTVFDQSAEQDALAKISQLPDWAQGPARKAADEAISTGQPHQDSGGLLHTLSGFIGPVADITRTAYDYARKPDTLAAKGAGYLAEKVTGSETVGNVVEHGLSFDIGNPFSKHNPAAEYMAFEQGHIGKPVYRSVITGIAAPFRVALKGESFDEAVRTGWKKSGQLGVIGDLGAMGFSPSTWFGAEELKGLMSADKFGLSGAETIARTSVLRDTAKYANIPELMGASDDILREIGPRGSTATDAALKRTEESLRDASKRFVAEPITRVAPVEGGVKMPEVADEVQQPGIFARIFKKPAALINPSIELPRHIHVAQNLRLGVKATDEALMHGDYQPVVKEAVQLWKTEAPKYIGPEGNKVAGTLLDFWQNPDFYEGASGKLRANTQKLGNLGDKWVEYFRTQRNVDVLPFRPDKADIGAIYVPNMGKKDDAQLVAGEIAANLHKYANLDKPGVIKPRYFQTAYERTLADPTFQPETDVTRLFGLHNKAMSGASGSEAFKLAAQGKNLVQVKDEAYPGLRLAKESVAAQLTSLQARKTTLDAKLARLGMNNTIYQSEIKRLVGRSEPVVDRLIDLGDDYGPELSFLAGQYHELSAGLQAQKVAAKSGLAKSAEARDTLDALNAEIKDVSGHLDDLRNGYKTAQIDPTKYMLSTATHQYHSPVDAKAIDSVLAQGKAGPIQDILDEMRLTVFSADLSPLIIQGFLASIAHPMNLARSAGRIGEIMSKGGEDYWATLARTDPAGVARFAEAWGREPGARGSRELGEVAAEKAKGLERVPVLGPKLKTLNNTLMDLVGAVQYNGWKTDAETLVRRNADMATHVADKESAAVWSHIVPEILQGERGVSPARAATERLPVISTSFISSPAVFMKDVASGMAKLALSTKLDPVERWTSLAGREQLSLERFVNMAGSLATLSAGSALLSAKANGQDPLEAIMSVADPNSPKFMSLVLGDKGSIGLGGPFRSFIRGMWPKQDQNGNWIPFAGMIPLLSLAEGNAVLPSFWKGKLAPSVSVLTGLLQNKDFRDQPIVTSDNLPTGIAQALWYGLGAHLPTTAGNVSEAFRTGQGTGLSALGIGTASQIAGANYKEVSKWDQLNMTRDDLARQSYNKNWEDLEPYQRAQLKTDHPEELAQAEATSPIGQAFDARSQLLAKFNSNQQIIDQQIPPGPAWAEAHRRLNIMKGAAIDQWEQDNPEAAKQLLQEPSSPGEAAIAQYFTAFDNSKTPWGDLDNELLAINLNKVQSTWTPDQLAYVQRNTGFNDTPEVKDWKAAQQVLAPYWQISDTIWTKLQTQFPSQYGQYAGLDDFVSAQVQIMEGRGMTEQQASLRVAALPIVQHYNDAVSRVRLQYRVSHPAVQTELSKWYGYEPPAQQAAQFTFGKGRKQQAKVPARA